jgi:cyclophilin family peptidyl-prolyl cis-trans isomerase
MSADQALAAIDDFISQQNIDKTSSSWRTNLPRPPKASFDSGSTYTWKLSTNKGVIDIRLMPDVAPMHVSSTVFLARLGFYDGLGFHRVIQGFMAQGGCPLGNGTGGPGYTYDGEFDASVRHNRPRLLSMANAGPGTDGSQFFLTFAATPHLDDNHTIFGEVSAGVDVLTAVEKAGSRGGATSEPLTIESTEITVA